MSELLKEGNDFTGNYGPGCSSFLNRWYQPVHEGPSVVLGATEDEARWHLENLTLPEPDIVREIDF